MNNFALDIIGTINAAGTGNIESEGPSCFFISFSVVYSDCQKNVPIAEGFFATTAYAAILLIGTYL
jgi:hypothetical protein